MVDATKVDGTLAPANAKVEEPLTPEKTAKKVVDVVPLMAKPVDTLRRHELTAILAVSCG